MKKLYYLSFLFIFPFYLQGQVDQEPIPANRTLLKSIFFGGGSYYIDKEQSQELADFIYAVENINRYEILVHSFTDNIGSISYNQWLSQQRSIAVIEELELLDIPLDVLLRADFGESNPIYDNATYEGKRRNRRVDVILRPLAF